MVKLSIDSKQIEVESGMTVLQACEIAGIEIPRFCYHERLSIAGNCRMCLVEVEGGPPKPVASCAMPVNEGMVVHTNTEMVKKAREGVLEFLLINHPLDCPICDQGGECDLQDQVMAYGCGKSRFLESKRAVEKKNFGPLIETAMNRCIHCTRCVRFLSEVAGTYELGSMGRGEKMEVGTYVQKYVKSELSGNIIDLCPVGALTSKPYSFKARSWELSHCETVDVLDAVGSNIRLDYRGLEVMRILPRLNEEINEEWISDKTRFACDGLKVQRLDSPYVRKNGSLMRVGWSEAYSEIENHLQGVNGEQVAAIAGDLADCESMFLLKELMLSLGIFNIDCRQDGARLSNQNRAHYLFNTTIAGIDHADACLLINTNMRAEAPIINARLRRRYLSGALKIAYLGSEVDHLYKVQNLGDNAQVLSDILEDINPFCSILAEASNPMLIIGQDALRGACGNQVLSLSIEIARKFNMVRDDWNGFNVLHKAAARVGGLDVGFVPKKLETSVADILNAGKKGKIKVLYLLGADEVELSGLDDVFIIYQGHHGDVGAHFADVVLPGAAYAEKSATYVNTEGRVQRTSAAVLPPGCAKEDWLIIKELAARLKHNFFYDSAADVQKKLVSLGEQFANIGRVIPTRWTWDKKPKVERLDLKFSLEKLNFYMTDPISRASKTMADCTRAFCGSD